MRLYLLFADNGLIKIGIASQVKNRIAQIKSSSPVPVECLLSVESDDCDRLEKNLHLKFRDKRVKGEWFALSYTDVLELIDHLKPHFLDQYSEASLDDLLSLLSELNNWGWFNLGHYEISRNMKSASMYWIGAFSTKETIC